MESHFCSLPVGWWWPWIWGGGRGLGEKRRDWETLNLKTVVDTVVARLGVGIEKRFS